MNNQEAKFILGAYRPDGRDAADPAFVEALGQAARDPELRAWLERERKFDTIVSGKLRDLAPPAELRASILAGSKASRPRRRWWTHPAWVAAAAAVMVLGVFIRILPGGQDGELGQMAALALRDLNEAHDQHDGFPAGLTEVQARLGALPRPVVSALGAAVDLDELKRRNCRSLRVAGREIFEICFERDGTWYHLFAMVRADPPGRAAEERPITSSRGEYTAAVWRDARMVYALVARGEEAVRKLI